MPGSVHPEDESMVDAQPLDEQNPDQPQEEDEGDDEADILENDQQRISIVRLVPLFPS